MSVRRITFTRDTGELVDIFHMTDEKVWVRNIITQEDRIVPVKYMGAIVVPDLDAIREEYPEDYLRHLMNNLIEAGDFGNEYEAVEQLRDILYGASE